jgi:hypothetical protein
LLTRATAISEHSAALVTEFIFNKFPSEAGGFKTELGYRILFRLSHSLSMLPYSPGKQPKRLNDHRHNIEKAATILEDLSKLLKGAFFDDTEIEEKPNKRNKQWSKRSQSNFTSGVHAEIDDGLFQALGHEGPRSRKSAKQLVQFTLDAQRHILKVWEPSSVIAYRVILITPVGISRPPSKPGKCYVNSQGVPSRKRVTRKFLDPKRFNGPHHIGS